MRAIKKVIAVSITSPHPGPLPGRERGIKRLGVSSHFGDLRPATCDLRPATCDSFYGAFSTTTASGGRVIISEWGRFIHGSGRDSR